MNNVRSKLDEKLQAEAIDILTVMIRRNLLTVTVQITDPSVSLSCIVQAAFLAIAEAPLKKR